MHEKVIIKQLRVLRPGQTLLFQVKLPADIKRIIGFEASVNKIEGSLSTFQSFYSGLPALTVYKSIKIGDVSLQSCGKTNLFYSTPVMLFDSSLNYGEIVAGIFNTGINEWTHTRKRDEDAVNVEEQTPILIGRYRDTFPDWGDHLTNYQANVYVWYSNQEEKKADES